MKKTFAVLAAALTLTTAPAASAAPVSLTGDISLKYGRETFARVPDATGATSTLRLTAEAELGAGWSLYARLGAQSATRPALTDFNGDAYADTKAVAALDQFGLTYKQGKFACKLGRQEAAVGVTALLYSRPSTNIGKKSFVDGLVLSAPRK